MAASPPPAPTPAALAERERVLAELRETLPRRYRTDMLKAYALPKGVGVSLSVHGELTPRGERDLPFSNLHVRARRLADAFLRDNPAAFLARGPGVELNERRLETSERHGLTHLRLSVEIAGVAVYGAKAVFALDSSGQLVTVHAEYPLIPGETLTEMAAAVPRATLTKNDVLARIEADRRRTKAQAAIDEEVSVEKFVYPSAPYVRWRVIVTFSTERFKEWGYEVDAEDGTVLRRSPPWDMLQEIAPTLPPLPSPPGEAGP